MAEGGGGGEGSGGEGFIPRKHNMTQMFTLQNV